MESRNERQAMENVSTGDLIFSAKHKGELLVMVAGTRALICRKLKKDGVPSLQEVVVSRDEVIGVKLRLPL
jgi:hypothetical protein